MEPKVRKQKVVSVCSAEHTPSGQLNYIYQKISSKSMKTFSSFRAPINAYNLILIEIYPECETKEQVSTLPCQRLDFATLCCTENTRAEDVRYDFVQEYPGVETVAFSGHIGSMRLAFELLKNFKRLKEVVLVVNDYNAQLRNEHGDSFQGIPQYKTVEAVKIIHDLTVEDKRTTDVQKSKWRLDEFLNGCRNCFPNLKTFEVSIIGSGKNYDKINEFILAHPQLNMRYTVEIQEGKVKTKLMKHPTSKVLPPVGSSLGTVFDKSAATPIATPADNHFAVDSIPDLSIVKKEKYTDKIVDEMPLNTSSVSEKLDFPHSANNQEHQSESDCQPHLLQDSLNQDQDPSMSGSIQPKFTFPADLDEAAVTSPSLIKSPNCGLEDTNATFSYNNQSVQPVSAAVPKPAQPLSLHNVPSSFNGNGRYADEQSHNQNRVVNRQSITSDSDYSEDDEGSDQEEEYQQQQLKLAGTRHGTPNPSPPPAATPSQNPVTNDVIQNANLENPESFSTNGKGSQTQQRQVRPRVPPPPPPVISRKPQDNDVVRKPTSYSDGPSTSQFPNGNGREISFDPRLKKRYGKSRSHSRSSTPPRQKRRYSPERSRQSSSDAHHHRRDEERRDRSRQSPSHVRGRSRSHSPRRGFKNVYKSARGGFKFSGRGPRCKGRGGFRSRPLRGRGKRGFRPSGYANNTNNSPDYYNDPRQLDGQNDRIGGRGGEAPPYSQEYMMD